MDGRIRILIADDHELVRSAIAAVLADEPNFEVVGQASDAREAIRMVQRLKPDVVVMDVDMPRVNGVDATRLIRGTWPSVRVVSLSFSDCEETAQSMRDAGAFAYVTKSSPMSVLVEAIREAAAVAA